MNPSTGYMIGAAAGFGAVLMGPHQGRWGLFDAIVSVFTALNLWMLLRGV